MPPPEYFRGFLWKLKKTVYGLGDAACAWYLRVKTELLTLGVFAHSSLHFFIGIMERN